MFTNFEMPENFTNKFAVMSYDLKFGKLPRLVNLRTELKSSSKERPAHDIVLSVESVVV